MESENKEIKIVCVGGGHVNCQVLKFLKKSISERFSGKAVRLTLVTESEYSFYSGMLPGTVSKLYGDDDLKVFLEPVAQWCNAEFIK